MVSAAGAVTIMLAAAAYGLQAWPWGVMLGLLLRIIGHLLPVVPRRWS